MGLGSSPPMLAANSNEQSARCLYRHRGTIIVSQANDIETTTTAGQPIEIVCIGHHYDIIQWVYPEGSLSLLRWSKGIYNG